MRFLKYTEMAVYFQRRCVSNISNKLKIEHSYKLLNVKEGCDQETVRKAYLDLAKRFHPDSGSPEANEEKFKEIESAFRILTKKFSQERWNVEEQLVQTEEFDIKHTAPQHRQYLSYEGVGFGSPAQREKQYIKKRAQHAAQNVMEHRLNKAKVMDGELINKSKEKDVNHTIKTQYGFDRLVEDLIQEAMSKGEFSNLPGSGKPLPSTNNDNPYVDFVTHKVNQILIDNGFTPEWIRLHKEIRTEIDRLKQSLLVDRSQLGTEPLSSAENEMWLKSIDKHKKLLDNINSKINHFNLVVPILNKQMLLISLEEEAQFALKNGKTKSDNIKDHKIQNSSKQQSDQNNIFFIFSSLFK